MRLIICLFLVTVSSVSYGREPVFSKAETTTTGCTLYTKEYSNSTNYEWSGKCVNGMLEGNGFIKYVTGEGNRRAYFQTFNNGQPVSPYYTIDSATGGSVSIGRQSPNYSSVSQSECQADPQCNELLKLALSSNKPPPPPKTEKAISVATKEPVTKGKVAAKGKGKAVSNLSIINLCLESNCYLQFVHYAFDEDPTYEVPEFFRRTNGTAASVTYVIKKCNIGWTASVGAGTYDSRRQQGVLNCGASTAKAAMEAAFSECSKRLGVNCKSEEIITFQYAYWDGSDYEDPNPEYAAKRKGEVSSIGGSDGGGCLIRDHDIRTCDEDIRPLVRSLGIAN